MLENEVLKKATKPFGAFKKNALGVDDSDRDEVKKHYLRGAWGDGTLKSYNSGVVKLLRFATVKSIDKSDLLPISAKTLKLFVVCASRKEVNEARQDESVNALTLKAYIAGIKAWHMYHDEEYPHQASDAVSTLLKASKMIEARMQQVERKRPPVLVSDLAILLEVLPDQGGERLSDVGGRVDRFLGNRAARRVTIRQPGEAAAQMVGPGMGERQVFSKNQSLEREDGSTRRSPVPVLTQAKLITGPGFNARGVVRAQTKKAGRRDLHVKRQREDQEAGKAGDNKPSKNDMECQALEEAPNAPWPLV